MVEHDILSLWTLYHGHSPTLAAIDPGAQTLPLSSATPVHNSLAERSSVPSAHSNLQRSCRGVKGANPTPRAVNKHRKRTAWTWKLGSGPIWSCPTRGVPNHPYFHRIFPHPMAPWPALLDIKDASRPMASEWPKDGIPRDPKIVIYHQHHI